MAKKQTAKKKVFRRPVARTWKVTSAGGDVTITAHDLSTWDGALTFTNRSHVTDDDAESTIVKAIAAGHWTDVELVPEPTAELVMAES